MMEAQNTLMVEQNTLMVTPITTDARMFLYFFVSPSGVFIEASAFQIIGLQNLFILFIAFISV